MEEVWKIAVLSTARRAEGLGAQMWQAWFCFLGNLLFKGCLTCFEAGTLDFSKIPSRKKLPNREFASLKRLLELYALENQW